MTKNDIIIKLKESGFVDNYIKQLANSEDHKYLDDITGEIWLSICEIDESRMLSMYESGGINEVRRFCSGIIFRQVKSTNSKVYRTYKKRYRQIEAVPTDAMNTIGAGVEVDVDGVYFSQAEVADVLNPIEAYIFNSWVEYDMNVERLALVFETPPRVLDAVVNRIKNKVIFKLTEHGYNSESAIDWINSNFRDRD